MPKGSEINMMAGDEPIQLGGFGAGAYDSQGQRGGLGKKFWQGPMGAAFYGSYLMKRLWGMTAGPEIQRAEQFAKSQTPLGIASGDASGIGGAASRLSFNEAAKGRSSYEVFGGFAEAAGSIADKNGVNKSFGFVCHDGRDDCRYCFDCSWNVIGNARNIRKCFRSHFRPWHCNSYALAL